MLASPCSNGEAPGPANQKLARQCPLASLILWPTIADCIATTLAFVKEPESPERSFEVDLLSGQYMIQQLSTGCSLVVKFQDVVPSIQMGKADGS